MGLEVGAIYKRGKKLYLAVDSRLLISFVGGTLEERKARGSFEIQRTLSVELLLRAWSITTDELDRVTVLYLRPADYRNVGKRQRRTARRGDADDEFEIFRSIRTFRFQNPQHKST